MPVPYVPSRSANKKHHVKRSLFESINLPAVLCSALDPLHSIVNWAKDRALQGWNPSVGPVAGIAGSVLSLPLFQLQSWRDAINPRGSGTCVREDLMNLLNERNRLG
jgi:hypothetical protein